MDKNPSSIDLGWARPKLMVVVDTEAEFDWTATPDSGATSVSAINNIHLVQEIFDEYQISPCYVIDYPMATQPESIQILQSIFRNSECEIGAHLHPWVNPPFLEKLNRPNMYPGNLDQDIEFKKLSTLTDQIESVFGVRPRTYKAGRYGFGEKTAVTLGELGYEVDLSFCPPFDFTDDGGPDFTRCDPLPFWVGENRSILAIPLSGAFTGIAGKHASPIHKFAGRFDAIKLRGILSRLGIVDRLLLSPEGHTPDEHRQLVKFLMNKGVRTFTWSFHSPSVSPGMTMYTQNDRDLKLFLDSFRRFFDFFLGELNGTSITPLALKSQIRDL